MATMLHSLAGTRMATTSIIHTGVRGIRNLLIWLSRPYRSTGFKIAMRFVAASVVLNLILLAIAAAALSYYTSSSNASELFRSTLFSQSSMSSRILEARGDNLALRGQLDAVAAKLQDDLQLQLPLALRLMFDGVDVGLIDSHGTLVMANSDSHGLMRGHSLTSLIGTDDSEPVRDLLNGKYAPQGYAILSPSGRYTGAMVLPGRPTEILWSRIESPRSPIDFWYPFGVVCAIWLVLTSILAGVMGLIAGAVTAKSMRRRLGAVASTADEWKGGNFASMCATWPDDDIGELGRRLNAMAVDLRDHVLSEQRVAKLEERTRLMRDLHDTVKQQAFAAAMQLGAARTVLGEDGGPAQVFVTQAEKLTNRVQEDLMSIIHEMRPEDADIATRSLTEILRRIAAEWSATNHIAVDVVVDPGIELDLQTRQTVSRIASEALANVRRHSEATEVRFVLHWDGSSGTIQLSIVDNGRGFDPSTVRHGMGLYSMRDRALSLPGGQYWVELKPGSGATVHVTWLGAEGRP